ncbi:hypothetical protein [Neobacillus soli]|uniref:hypothetical protein n=1 Tax=Neobacillus soli TaxID=220688 RepID=UPI000826FD00|nr:hypothetical protein [Neobacillus soli]
MKKEMLLVIVSFFLMSLTAITGVYAIEKNDSTIIISKEEADITGDGRAEHILLQGVPYQGKESFLKKIFIKVAASNGKTYTFPLESGAKAALQLRDLNHDGVKDIFTCVLTGGSGGITINSLFSLKNFVHTELHVPEPLEMESKFSDGYKAEIKLTEIGKTYLFDLKDRKNYYKKLGLYYKGKLNEPMELTVNPYSSLQPIQLENEKLGLKGLQRITGIANADTIALVESTWNYENGHWNLFSTEVRQERAQ